MLLGPLARLAWSAWSFVSARSPGDSNKRLPTISAPGYGTRGTVLHTAVSCRFAETDRRPDLTVHHPACLRPAVASLIERAIVDRYLV
jgi:hypothetical protein